MKSYRPTNGTEGDIFMGQFCFRCIKESRCSILTGAMAGKSPRQWVQDDDGPRCTSFRDHKRPTNYRCRKTTDLFNA